MAELLPEQTLETVLFGEQETRLTTSGSLKFEEEFDNGLIPINAEFHLSRNLLTTGERFGNFIQRYIKQSHKVQIPRRAFSAENDDLQVWYHFAELPKKTNHTLDEPKDPHQRTGNYPALHFLEVIFKDAYMHKTRYDAIERYDKMIYAIHKHYHPELPDYKPSDPRLRFVFKEIIWGDHIDPRPHDKRYIETDDTIGIHNVWDYKNFLEAFPTAHRLFAKDAYYNASEIVKNMQRLAFEHVVQNASGESSCITALNDFYQAYLISGPQVQRRINDGSLDYQYWVDLTFMDHDELAKDNDWRVKAKRVTSE